MQQIRLWIRKYFAFSQRETSAFLLLLVLMVLTLAVPFFYKPSSKPYDTAKDQQILDSLAAILDQQVPEKNFKNYRKEKPVVALKPFNPNNLTAQDWEAFGVDKFIAKRIINYREKAGDFKYKSQLQKIYGFPEELYAAMEPFILLPETAQNSREFAGKPNRYENHYAENSAYKNRPAKAGFKLQPFDINTADTTELKKIKGIGSKLSIRILKYRDRLGGFTSEEQFAEVFALPAGIADSLLKYTYVENDFRPKKLNLNAVTFEDLKTIPYLKYNLSRAIIAYRDMHGPYKTAEDLKKIKLMDEATFSKLRPYLAI